MDKAAPMFFEAKAFAKINISLDIVAKMPDGYHDLKTVMQSVSLHDTLEITCERGEGIRLLSNLGYIPNDERNLAARAAKLFFEYTGISGYSVAIKILKRIPVCAGLGGGSTDAASVLRALDEMFVTGLGREALEELGLKIGSDVPFCVDGGTSLAEGRGEILTDVAPLPQCSIVICKPGFSISTPSLFAKIKAENIRSRPDTAGIIESLELGSLGGIARRMYNVFEDVLPNTARDVLEIKRILLEYDALGAAMTGSGSAVFGIFEDKEAAGRAHGVLERTFRDSFIAEPVGRFSAGAAF